MPIAYNQGHWKNWSYSSVSRMREVYACTCVRIGVIHYILSQRIRTCVHRRIETISSSRDERFDKFRCSIVLRRLPLSKNFLAWHSLWKTMVSLRILDFDSRVVTCNPHWFTKTKNLVEHLFSALEQVNDFCVNYNIHKLQIWTVII